MSDLTRIVTPPTPAPYRIVSGGADSAVLEYAYHIESAKAFASLMDGEIEAYVYGIGWVPWLPSMSEKGRHDLKETKTEVSK
jgi:hypothetical protein